MKIHRDAHNFRARLVWFFILGSLLWIPACTPAAAPPPAAVEPGASDRPAGTVPLMFRQGDAEEVQIVPVHLGTGQRVEKTQPIEIGSEISYAFSPDRTRLAIASKGAACQGGCLRIFQLDGLQEVFRTDLHWMDLPGEWVNQVVFDPQGQRLAMTWVSQGQARLALMDLSRPAPELLQVAELAAYPRLLAFSADGKQILLIGSIPSQDRSAPPGNNSQVQALLLDAPALKEAWRQTLPAIFDGLFGPSNPTKPEDITYYQAGLAVDAANQRVYIAHAESDQLTTVDFKARRTTTVTIRKPQAALERIAEALLSIGVRPVQAKAGNTFIRSALLSQDGQTLYVGGAQTRMVDTGNGSEFKMTTTGLEAWDISSGTRLLQIDSPAREIRWGLNGKILLNGYDPNERVYHPYTEIFDPAQGRITTRLADTYAFTTLASNGQPALVSAYLGDHGVMHLGIPDEQNQQNSLRWTENTGAPDWFELR